MTAPEPQKPSREVLAVARELARATSAEAARIMGPDAKAWDDLPPERRARSIKAMMPLAQIAVDTSAAVRLARIINHPSLFLVHDAFDRADEKGYTRAHDQEHGADVLIQAGTAYCNAAAILRSHPESGGKLSAVGYGWPFPDGWHPTDAVTSLVKAAHLLLSAADVIEVTDTASEDPR